MTDQVAGARAQTVLVAEDDRDIRELVQAKLISAGYRVISVGDGVAALCEAREQPPDIALLDVTMPGLSGLEVVRTMREDESTASVPVILLSAKSQEFDVETGIALGAADYVVKPFSPRELVHRIDAVLSRARA